MERITKYLVIALIIPFIIASGASILLIIAEQRFPTKLAQINITNIVTIFTNICLVFLTFDLIIVALFPLRKNSQYNDICRKGYILHRLGKYEAAAYCFETALQIKSDAYDTHYVLGNTLGQRGLEAEEKSGKGKGRKFFEEAKKSYNVIIEKYKEERKNEKSIIRRLIMIVWKKQIKEEDYWNARYGRAHILFRLEKYPCAVKEFKEVIAKIAEVIKQRPTFIEAHYALGNVLGEWGNREKMESKKKEFYEEAEKSFRKAIRYKEDYWEAHKNLANILYNLYCLTGKVDKLSEAKEQFEIAKKIKSDFYEIHYGLGNVLGELGNKEKRQLKAKEYYESAEKSYNEAIKLNPDFEQAYVNLYVVLKKLRKENERNDLKKEFWKHFRKVLK